jgi:phosphate transport system substrate-binding protein
MIAAKKMHALSLLTLLSSVFVAAQTPASPRKNAAYLLPDGSVQMIASAGMSSLVKSLDALFLTTHSGYKFSVAEGDNYSAMAALTFDRTLVAPLGCEYTRIGLGDNLKIAADPIGFRIAHASLTPGARVPALGVIVNPKNPLASLSMTQLTRIFAVGGPGGDIATWSQAGVKSDLAGRTIVPVGPMPSDYLDSDDPQAGEFLSTDKMSGLNMNHAYVALTHYADVVQRVSEDPAAIGITAFNMPLNGVKVIPLKNTETGTAVQPDAASIANGNYPLDRFIYMYVRVGKGMPPDAFALEYMRTVLSDEGQRIIAADAAGYIPLNAPELAQERAKLGQ